MPFSEQVQQLCAEVSAEQALSLREYIVLLTERAEANPGVWNTSLKTLIQEASDEGFDAANLLATLQELAKAAVPVEDQVRLAAELEKQLAGNASIREITAEISSANPSLKAKMLELVEAARTEARSLTGVAGGTSHNGDFKKTWQKTPNATKKQKWEKRGIDALEVFAGLSLINYGLYTWKEQRMGKAIIEIKTGNPKGKDSGFYDQDLRLYKGEFRHRKMLGIVVTDRKFDTWFGRGGRINFEINRFMPGGFFRSIHQGKKDFIDFYGGNSSDPNTWRSSVSSELESHESGIESALDNIDITRVERRLERNSADIAGTYKSLINRNSPSVKTHPDLRRAWSTYERRRIPSISIDLDELKSDVAEEAKQLGGDVERAVITDTTNFVEEELDVIESE